MGDVQAVNVADLKNRLSHYLRLVKKGQSILVRDRDQVVARIEPAGSSALGAEERLEQLEMRGVIRKGKGVIGPDLLGRRPKVHVDVVEALLREREEGR